MSKFLAFPLRPNAEAVHARLAGFRRALWQIHVGSPAELAGVERARTANEELVGIFNALPPLAGGPVDDRGERLLHAGESSVLAPITQLTAANRRDNLRAQAVADSAQQAAFRSEIIASLLGVLAVVWFAIFAVRLVRRIDSQNHRLQLADTAKDEFIGTVSHELRTPLTSMHGFVELLLDEGGDPLTEQQRGFLATVQRGAERLERLVDDLLLTAQLDAGRLDILRTPTDVVEIVQHAVESAQAEAGRRALRLDLTAPSHSILIEADVVRLAQAVDNVVSNAMKFTPGGGSVAVTLAQDGGRVTVTIADTGMGMAAADVERLFERFFRTDSAQAKQIQGTGLGLPIVKAIVEAHEGTIAVTSEPNVGTSFAISLPLPHPLGRVPAVGPKGRFVTA
jgi:signal transduction histidine kinase